jgi:phosphohistidine phosphatase
MSVRTLVVLRHAKADRPNGVADEDRPLTERGHADAAAAGAWLATRGYRPDLVLCSPAKRTRQTWRAVALAVTGPHTPEVRYEPALYHGGVAEALDLVRGAPEEAGTVLLIGHNPTVSMLSAVLAQSTEQDNDGLRTSGIAVHTHDGDWAGFGRGAAPIAASFTARA